MSISIELSGKGETQINVHVLYQLAPSRSGHYGVLVGVRAGNGHNANAMPMGEHTRASVNEYPEHWRLGTALSR
jgi:hypothetical protein